MKVYGKERGKECRGQRQEAIKTQIVKTHGVHLDEGVGLSRLTQGDGPKWGLQCLYLDEKDSYVHWQ